MRGESNVRQRGDGDGDGDGDGYGGGDGDGDDDMRPTIHDLRLRHRAMLLLPPSSQRRLHAHAHPGCHPPSS